DWMRKQSVFKDLNWDGAGVTLDEYVPFASGWFREVQFGNAAWQMDREDSFLVEFLDKTGTVLDSISARRKDFLAENPTGGHSRVSWRAEGIPPPNSAGDKSLTPIQQSFALFKTTVRVDVATSTNPFKSVKIPEITGEGAVRVTWSHLPNHPFYFPVN